MLFLSPPVPAAPVQTSPVTGQTPAGGTITALMVEPVDQHHLYHAAALRCAVFCNEKNWFRPQLHAAGQWVEQDLFDAVARHFVAVQHLPDGYDQVIATIRVVPYSAQPGLPTGCVAADLYGQLEQRGLALDTVAEVSRLCLAPQFRNHPAVLTVLLRELYRYSKQAGIGYWVASMEDALCRLLRANAIPFEPLDNACFDYFGAVRTYLLGVEQAEACMEQQREPLFHYFTAAPYARYWKGDRHVPVL